MAEKIFDLEDRLVEFSELLPSTRAGNYIAGQLIRCGLAPAYCMGKHRVQNPEWISYIK